ncbi:MAG TPA: LPXTG cell wall anchor domain-containing protein, partial [Actinomycetota bacterium]
KGGKCMGKASVEVPHDAGVKPVDSGLKINSFESAQLMAQGQTQVLPLQLPRTGSPVRTLALLGGALLGGGTVLLVAVRRRRARA